ncbi:MAG TPA: hypothetical protein VFP68_12925, partial [Burkholderiaceae bacterium]|nr:hypothetical protein [Burkholderiaceae bacterium]
MFLSPSAALSRAIAAGLVLLLLLVFLAPAWAQNSPSEANSGIKWKVCDHPPICFRDKQARQAWASEHDCRFLEDVCDRSSTGDDKGAPPEDQGFWGQLWSGVKDGLVYGYQFVKGLIAGMKDQVVGLVDLLRNVDEVVAGLIDLGKQFYKDPKGTITRLAE